MTPTQRATGHQHSWLRRTLVAPLLRMLRHGASPRRLAWSLTVGIVIGINPVLGSTTLATLIVAHMFRLNHTASQVGAQAAYPLQLLLLLPFLRAGTLLFGAAPMPMQGADVLPAMRQHPLQLVRLLWTWEWHALVLWLALASVAAPLLATALRHMLERATSRRARSLAA